MLFKQYCSSHYGCVLWDLTNKKLEEYCIAWRKGVRKIWSLPHDSSGLNVALISESLPILDEISRRTWNFLHSCINSDSQLVRSVTLTGVSGSRLNSPLGRNAAFCASHFKTSMHSIGVVKLSSHFLFERFKFSLSSDQLDIANVTKELILIRDGVLSVHDSRFHRDDFNYMINDCAT
jgi:hypothetical protein